METSVSISTADTRYPAMGPFQSDSARGAGASIIVAPNWRALKHIFVTWSFGPWRLIERPDLGPYDIRRRWDGATFIRVLPGKATSGYEAST
jgi:hypothetical protein